MRRFAALLLLTLVLAPLASAAATKGPVFGLRAVGNPKLGYFVYSLTAGAAQQGGVIISNSGTATGTVKLFAADATTGRTTGTVYLTDGKPKRVGSWISLSSSSLTLKPGQNRTVHFTVHVPANEKPGQWVGGIVAETSRQVTGAKSKQKASVQIKIRDLTIVAVQVNIPGPPVISFKIGGVKTGGQRGFQEVVTHIENNGNVLVKPTGTVTVLDDTGATLQVLNFKMDTFLPETTIDYPVLLKNSLPPGDYSAIVKLSIPGVSGAAAKVVSAHPSFSISKQDVQQVFTSAAPQTPPPGTVAAGGSSKPWTLIGAVVAGVLLLLLLLLWLLRRRRSEPTGGTTVVPRSTSAAAAVAPRAVASIVERTEPPAAVPPPLPPEPAPQPQPEPVQAAAASTPVPMAPSQPAPVRQARNPECDPDHFWEVAYDRGELGEDGVWRFPHRCRNCGLELMASDVADASAQAERS
jgi:MYXO-CTERM domain-containing protein